MDFEIVDKGDIFVIYKLIDNEFILKKYLYFFELIINYILNDNSIEVEWIVKNIDFKDIFFFIGGYFVFNFFFYE